MASRQLLVLLVLLGAALSVLGGQMQPYSFGGRNNYVYTPTNVKPNAPMFTILHGCTQNPTDIAAGSKMNTYADIYGFVVLYPEQPSSANMNKCWNWFEVAHQSRGSGEPKLIADMTQSIIQKYSVDATRVFVAGISAGGGMSNIVGACYPDIFAAIGSVSGLEYKAATDMISAFTAMREGGPAPATQAQLAYQAGGSSARVRYALVTQGTADTTVYPVNGNQIATQWAVYDNKVGISVPSSPNNVTKGRVPNGRSYTTNAYYVGSTTYVTYILVDGMSHAWPGGSSSGTYTDPQGPDASQIMCAWFLGSSTPVAPVPVAPVTPVAPTPVAPVPAPVPVAPAPVPFASPVPHAPSNSLTITSQVGETGYVGQYLADGYSSSQAKVGDKGMYNLDTYRTILSFETSNLPFSSIKAATLSISMQSSTGSVRTIIVDVKNGCFGGGAPALAQAEYDEPADFYSAFEIPIPTEVGGVSQVDLPSAVLRFLQPGGGACQRIQFRLRGQETASFLANTVFINGPADTNPPLLTVQY